MSAKRVSEAKKETPAVSARVPGLAVSGLVCLCVLLLLAPAAAGRLPAIGPEGEVIVPPFGVGEMLTFEVKYGFVSAGTAIMGIPELAEERGYTCYHIVSIAESSEFFSVFFRVRDLAESFMDVRELVSRRFEKHLREGDFKADDVTLFDHDRHVAIYPAKNRLVPIAQTAQDILSSLYYVRTMDLMVGKSVFIENHADRKNYPLEIKVLRKERVTVPAGTFDCIVIEPIMRATGVFRHKGKLTVFMTDDERHVPVQMKSKVLVGSISAVLTRVAFAE